VTLGIGKQFELPRRPGDYKTAKGDMNAVPGDAEEEAGEMKARNADHAKQADAMLKERRGLVALIKSLIPPLPKLRRKK
jgi:hypothetical protein